MIFDSLAGLARCAAVALAVSIFFLHGCSKSGNNNGNPSAESYKVGVILSLSGDLDIEARELLTWAVGEINAAGPVAGRAIELEFADPVTEGLDQAAARLANDPKVLAVIGPTTSTSLDTIARTFINKKKVLVSPSATSEDIFRSYAGKKYIWRTVEADSAQMEVMVSLAASGGASTAALITSQDIYGLTFYNWFSFLAIEAGLSPVGSSVYPADAASCETYVAEAALAKPDVLFAVALDPEHLACILRRAREVSPATRVIFSDGASPPGVPARLGLEAEGMEGLASAPAPLSGFEDAYQGRFNKEPPVYSANTWDSLLIIVYGLARSGGKGGEALAEAMMDVVDGRGQKAGWNREGISAALKDIESGQLPDISGASGPLDYDKEFHTDPTSSYYAHWEIEGGAFITRHVYLSGTARPDDVATARQYASDVLMTTFSASGAQGPAAPRKGLWALIVAGSSGWANYRHQADALAQYRYLRENGVPDERIILVLADDLAYSPLNFRPGEIQYRQNGENLYVDVKVDYLLGDVDAQDLMAILSGKSSLKTPTVIASGPDDNIYVFLSGHGIKSGFMLSPEDGFNLGSGTILTPEALKAALDEMAGRKAYRQMLLVVESCYSGLLGKDLTAPNILVLTAASPNETSLAHNRRLEDGAWLADQFSYQFWRAAVEVPDMTIADAYEWTYKRVSGSHVSIYNAGNFEGASGVSLSSFMSYTGL